jgi:hypothetical protein
MTTGEYAYARARRPVKVTLPSPLMLFLVWSPQRSRDAYPDPFEMFADGLRLTKEADATWHHHNDDRHGGIHHDVDWSTDAAIASAPWYGPRHGSGFGQ